MDPGLRRSYLNGYNSESWKIKATKCQYELDGKLVDDYVYALESSPGGDIGYIFEQISE